LSVAALTALLQLLTLTLAPAVATRSLFPAALAAALDYGREPYLALPALTRSFLIDALGREYDLLVGQVRSLRPQSAGGRAQPPQPTDAPKPPASAPESGPLGPILAEGSWDLRPSLRADRTTVRPGGEVGYRVVVRNEGREPFGGIVRLQAHIPFWSTYARGEPPCAADPEHSGGEIPDVCIDPVPVPGTPGDAQHVPDHTQNFTRKPLQPGRAYAFVYFVRVAEGAPSETQLTNHLHMTVTAPPRPTITTDPVVVVVR
jgi:uncharacterized repeat protein (TIGR01451 family)